MLAAWSIMARGPNPHGLASERLGHELAVLGWSSAAPVVGVEPSILLKRSAKTKYGGSEASAGCGSTAAGRRFCAPQWRIERPSSSHQWYRAAPSPSSRSALAMRSSPSIIQSSRALVGVAMQSSFPSTGPKDQFMYARWSVAQSPRAAPAAPAPRRRTSRPSPGPVRAIGETRWLVPRPKRIRHPVLTLRGSHRTPARTGTLATVGCAPEALTWRPDSISGTSLVVARRQKGVIPGVIRASSARSVALG